MDENTLKNSWQRLKSTISPTSQLSRTVEEKIENLQLRNHILIAVVKAKEEQVKEIIEVFKEKATGIISDAEIETVLRGVKFIVKTGIEKDKKESSGDED